MEIEYFEDSLWGNKQSMNYEALCWFISTKSKELDFENFILKYDENSKKHSIL